MLVWDKKGSKLIVTIENRKSNHTVDNILNYPKPVMKATESLHKSNRYALTLNPWNSSFPLAYPWQPSKFPTGSRTNGKTLLSDKDQEKVIGPKFQILF